MKAKRLVLILGILGFAGLCKAQPPIAHYLVEQTLGYSWVKDYLSLGDMDTLYILPADDIGVIPTKTYPLPEAEYWFGDKPVYYLGADYLNHLGVRRYLELDRLLPIGNKIDFTIQVVPDQRLVMVCAKRGRNVFWQIVDVQRVE